MFKFDPVGPDPNVAQWGRGFVSALFCTVLVVCGPETVSTCKLEFDVVGSQKQCTGSFYMLVVSSDDKLNLEFDVLNLVFLCVNGHDTQVSHLNVKYGTYQTFLTNLLSGYQRKGNYWHGMG